MKSFLALAVGALVIFSYANNIDIVRAGDPDPLQDFCVAEYNTKVTVNGFPCKDKVTADDFFFKGLDKPGNTSNQLGVAVKQVAVKQVSAMQLPGLNTLGISMVRVDFAPGGGLKPPHTHPRATELLVVIEGTLYVGFITTNNELVSKTLEKGDVFVFPKGLVHFQQNVGTSNAFAIAALNSQNPGVQQVAQSLFGATDPAVDPSILARAFQIKPYLVQQIQKKISAGG